MGKTISAFKKQNQMLINFDQTFNPNSFSSCVERAMLLIKNREAQMIEEGYDWPINTESCRWAIYFPRGA